MLIEIEEGYFLESHLVHGVRVAPRGTAEPVWVVEFLLSTTPQYWGYVTATVPTKEAALEKARAIAAGIQRAHSLSVCDPVLRPMEPLKP